MAGIISSIGGIIGGAIGNANASQYSGQANNDLNQANQILQNIPNAPDLSAPLSLQQYKQSGVYNPAMEQAIQQGPSAVAGLGTDQGSLNAQRAALQQMAQTASMGMTAQQRAALNEVNQQTGSQISGRQQALMNQLNAQAGGAGSMTGLKLMNALNAQQEGANEQANQSQNIMANAQANALNAAAQEGSMGSQLNSQLFGQALTKAQAQDQLNRFNVQQQTAAQNANVQAQNQGQQYNLNNVQNLSNANVTSANQAAYNQQAMTQQQYEDTLQNAGVKAGGYQNLAGYQNQQAQQAAQAGANLGGGIGGTLGGLGAATGMFGTQAQNSYLNSGKSSGSGTTNNYNIGLSSGGQIHDFRKGGTVPGQAVVQGDSPKNDIVPAMLSPGEIVLPRTMAQSSLGKRLAKLLEDHHSLRADMERNNG
jgi:hypothetical protein